MKDIWIAVVVLLSSVSILIMLGTCLVIGNVAPTTILSKKEKHEICSNRSSNADYQDCLRELNGDFIRWSVSR